MNQILPMFVAADIYFGKKFQSPKSGKFESNSDTKEISSWKRTNRFQSPKSGKFESNVPTKVGEVATEGVFQSPKSGKFESNVSLKSKFRGLR